MDDDQRFDAAKARLQAAATEYAQITREGAFVGSWVLVMNVQSIDLEAEERSETHLVEPTGQPWFHSLGLLRAGTITHERGAWLESDPD